MAGSAWLISLHNGGDAHTHWETHFFRAMAAGLLSSKVHLSDIIATLSISTSTADAV